MKTVVGARFRQKCGLFAFCSVTALKDRWNSDFLKPVSLGRRFGYNEAVCPLAMIMWSLRDSAIV